MIYIYKYNPLIEASGYNYHDSDCIVTPLMYICILELLAVKTKFTHH